MKTLTLTIKMEDDVPDSIFSDAINEVLRSPGIYEHILDDNDEGWYYL